MSRFATFVDLALYHERCFRNTGIAISLRHHGGLASFSRVIWMHLWQCQHPTSHVIRPVLRCLHEDLLQHHGLDCRRCELSLKWIIFEMQVVLGLGDLFARHRGRRTYTLVRQLFAPELQSLFSDSLHERHLAIHFYRRLLVPDVEMFCVYGLFSQDQFYIGRTSLRKQGFASWYFEHVNGLVGRGAETDRLR